MLVHVIVYRNVAKTSCHEVEQSLIIDVSSIVLALNILLIIVTRKLSDTGPGAIVC